MAMYCSIDKGWFQHEVHVLLCVTFRSAMERPITFEHTFNRRNTSLLWNHRQAPAVLPIFFSPWDYQVTRAQTLVTPFLIEHNVSFAALDHLTDLVKMFLYSSIAAKFSLRRTKSTATGRTMGQETKGNIIGKIKDKPFSLSTDGSSDRGADEQLYLIVIRYYDYVKQVTSALLEITTTKESSTGKNIFKLLDDVLKQYSIPWKNVLCFGADNAAVMIGIHNGVMAFVRKEDPNVFVLGCP